MSGSRLDSRRAIALVARRELQARLLSKAFVVRRGSEASIEGQPTYAVRLACDGARSLKVDGAARACERDVALVRRSQAPR